jgi:hypothetical protein
MTTAQVIVEQVMLLPDDAQREVLDFVEFLANRNPSLSKKHDDATWSMLSLASAMRGMEDEESPYRLSDLKESFR